VIAMDGWAIGWIAVFGPLWLAFVIMVRHWSRHDVEPPPIVWVVDCRKCGLHLEFMKGESGLARQARRMHDEYCDGIKERVP